jgi:hypothetical protein
VAVEYVGNEDVYDLTVEGEHEFFANGIVVHNCMSAMRYVYQFRWPWRLGRIENKGVSDQAIYELGDEKIGIPDVF